MAIVRSILFACLSFAVVPASAAPKVGDRPPDLLGRDASGQELRVSDHPGKVVIVTFWASWCAPCLQELPILDNMQRMAGEDRIKVIAINFKEPGRQYRRVRGRLNDAAIALTHDARGTVSDAYGVRSLPHMFMIDRAGRIAHIHKGYSEAMLDSLVEEINALINAPAD